LGGGREKNTIFRFLGQERASLRRKGLRGETYTRCCAGGNGGKVHEETGGEPESSCFRLGKREKIDRFIERQGGGTVREEQESGEADLLLELNGRT